jgi:hypothetical protein
MGFNSGFKGLKIFPVVSQLFHSGRQTDRQTDMSKLIVDFGNFAEAHKKQSYRIPTPRILLKLSVLMFRVIAEILS